MREHRLHNADRILAGEFDTGEFLENRDPLPSGRRERRYERPSFEDDAADPGELIDYLESADIYRVRAMVEGQKYVTSNYGQGGLGGGGWER